MQTVLKLKSPGNEQFPMIVPAEASRLDKSFNGSICSANGDEFEVEANIINVLGNGPKDISMAQSTNHWRITAEAYESLWRKRSVGFFSGEDFTLQDEAALLGDWLKPCSGEIFLDLGCSTAFYARSIKESWPDASVVALDFSRPMLEKAREEAVKEGRDMYLVRADARNLPFYAGTFDGIASGGTLNELTDPIKVLYECRRVIKNNGRFFIMYLLKAESWYGRLLQQGSGIGGIQYWTEDESAEMFRRVGFNITALETRGIVCFALLEPVE
jgi:ubiquinone/menaquinone biosynthesis C-methylase UbiE